MDNFHKRYFIECEITNIWMSHEIPNVNWLVKAVKSILSDIFISQWYLIRLRMLGDVRDVALIHYSSCTDSIKPSLQFLCYFVVINASGRSLCFQKLENTSYRKNHCVLFNLKLRNTLVNHLPNI
jgi:hypothetical protein